FSAATFWLNSRDVLFHFLFVLFQRGINEASIASLLLTSTAPSIVLRSSAIGEVVLGNSNGFWRNSNNISKKHGDSILFKKYSNTIVAPTILVCLIYFFSFGAGIKEHEAKHQNDTSTEINTASYINGNFTFEKFVDHRTNRCLTTPEQFNCKSWSKECKFGGTSTILQGKSLFDSKWKIVERGRFDAADWENRTLTKILPELPALATRLYDLTKRAQLYSEKIPCTAETAASKNFDPNIGVSFKFWATKNITLTVFLYDPVKDTVIASSSVFHQKSKLYPGPFLVKFVHFSQQPFVVRFLAQGTFKAPGFLFLDDVAYVGQFCKNSTCLSTVKNM
uniref:Uncharacterized protein n=1 Tax=Romanomermis culicivorax TaxID=13658 RepID=A0A915ITY0_ROMCU